MDNFVVLDTIFAISNFRSSSRSPPIIHRDLKTPNVLLCSTDPNFNGPLAKVSDFGASAQMFMTSLQSGNIGSSDKVLIFFFFFFFFFFQSHFLSSLGKKTRCDTDNLACSRNSSRSTIFKGSLSLSLFYFSPIFHFLHFFSLAF